MAVPIRTLVVLTLSLAAYASPELASSLIYDRAAITHGEIWRLVSAHVVHFSRNHLFYDLLAFGIAGWMIEHTRYQYYGMLYPLLALPISLTLLIMKPGMGYYGGLSGLTYGSVYYLALFGLRDSPPWRLLCMLTLGFLSLKIAIEAYSQPLIIGPDEHAFVPMPLSHAIGALAAILLFLYSRVSENRRKS